MMEDKILEVEAGIIDNLCDKPEPSLCDSCQFAYEVPGGFVSIQNILSGWIQTYKQRYCPYPLSPEKTDSRNIIISGFAECEYYQEFDNIQTSEQKYTNLEVKKPPTEL